ncbi:MAG: hypothetical protein VB084_11950 [Syntrophomonadaceae bacterium]|nr:hypothetical protein [Syntrophomonadaceae bacterium]
MKKSTLLIALILTLSLVSAGCSDGSSQNMAASTPQSEPGSSVAERVSESSALAETKTAKLWPGTVNDSLLSFFETRPWEYTGGLTVETLAEGLSQTTGLNYFVTAKKVEDGISVDWANDSTLVANLADREQKKEFHFYDADSMRWFMMDSLLLTINDNLAPENVYYTMNGGKDLVFEALDPISEFPADLPYMGSNFYFAHADGTGKDNVMGEGRGDLIE